MSPNDLDAQTPHRTGIPEPTPRNPWIPGAGSRALMRRWVGAHPPDRFRSYRAYFYFIHLDPVVRFWHALGMLVGLALFVAAAVEIDVLLVAVGVFFFYGFGYLSHVVYDGGLASTPASQFLASIPWAFHINGLTLSGRYARRLPEILGEDAWVLDTRPMGRITRSVTAERS